MLSGQSKGGIGKSLEELSKSAHEDHAKSRIITETRLYEDMKKRRCKVINVYKNGDKYTPAIKVILTKREQTDPDMLLKAIAEKVVLKSNKPILRLYDNSGKRLPLDGSLDDGQICVAATSESFIRVDYGTVLPQMHLGRARNNKYSNYVSLFSESSKMSQSVKGTENASSNTSSVEFRNKNLSRRNNASMRDLTRNRRENGAPTRSRSQSRNRPEKQREHQADKAQQNEGKHVSSEDGAEQTKNNHAKRRGPSQRSNRLNHAELPTKPVIPPVRNNQQKREEKVKSEEKSSRDKEEKAIETDSLNDATSPVNHSSSQSAEKPLVTSLDEPKEESKEEIKEEPKEEPKEDPKEELKEVPVEDKTNNNNHNEEENEHSLSIEDPENANYEEAATKIQAGFRGYRTRKQLNQTKVTFENNQELETEQNVNDPSREIEENKHDEQANEETANEEQLNAAATKIQAGFRGYQTRKGLEEAKLQEQPDLLEE